MYYLSSHKNIRFLRLETVFIRSLEPGKWLKHSRCLINICWKKEGKKGGSVEGDNIRTNKFTLYEFEWEKPREENVTKLFKWISLDQAYKNIACME